MIPPEAEDGSRRKGWRSGLAQVAMALAVSAATIACALPPSLRSTETPFSPRTDPAFGDATAAIRRLLAAWSPRIEGVQHFCAIGYRQDDDRVAWVHWREAGRLILWLGKGDGSGAAESLVRSRRNLDLQSDVVPTEADIASSTYRVTQAWVSAKLADCAAGGDQYAIRAPH